MLGDTRRSLQKVNVTHWRNTYRSSAQLTTDPPESKPPLHIPPRANQASEGVSLGFNLSNSFKCWEMRKERTDHSKEKHSEQYLAVGHLVEIFVRHVDLKRVHTCSKTKFKGVAM